ncbi:benzoylformate decarboxylase [Streptomyces sp. NPDC091376]|uniref:benzoylformate decarboxylase n=1 Tax=Streptomyces sp. NPDC091376 TaxID=3365994 RepID=UPI00382E1D7C
MSDTSSGTVRDRFREFLAANGTSVVFGNPGSTELPFFADWPEDLRWVMALQEASAVAMADGYAQATGRPALVTLHSAAGTGNGMCGIYSACRNHSPVVVLAGQQVRAMLPTDPYLFAERPTDFPAPYAKWAIEPARAEDVPAALARAWRLAAQRPAGPAFVSVPMDDWERHAEPVPPIALSDRFAAEADALSAVAAKLAVAARPVLVVGPETERDGATGLAVELAERTGAAVWSGPHINRSGFPEDHPSFRGQLRPSRALIRTDLADADLVVVLGAPAFLYHVYSPGTPVPAGTEVVVLSEDPALLARAECTTGVRTCLREGLAGLLAALPEAARNRPAPSPRPAPASRGGAAPMSGESALGVLGTVLPADTLIIEELPTFREIRWQHLPVRRPGGYFSAASGGLGWGLPASVGVALADPARTVVCLIGDGSFQYSVQALWTAARLGLRLVVVVFNNGAYAAMRDLSLTLGAQRPPSYELPGIDIVHLAQGYSCAGVRAADTDQLADAVRTALAGNGCTVIDAHIADEEKRLYG